MLSAFSLSCTVGYRFLNIAVIMLSMVLLLLVFQGGGLLWRAFKFCQSHFLFINEMIMWFLSLSIFRYCITFIASYELNHSCISGMKVTAMYLSIAEFSLQIFYLKFLHLCSLGLFIYSNLFFCVGIFTWFGDHHGSGFIEWVW